MRTLLGLLGLAALCLADTYLHNPRGSNNRLNEPSAERHNANRMFDSQNNNRGGYNKGDYSDAAASATPADTLALQYMQQYDEACRAQHSAPPSSRPRSFST